MIKIAKHLITQLNEAYEQRKTVSISYPPTQLVRGIIHYVGEDHILIKGFYIPISSIIAIKIYK